MTERLNNKLTESRINLWNGIVLINIIGFIVYGSIRLYKSISTGMPYLFQYIMDKENLYANAYLEYSIAGGIFIFIAIVGYSVLAVMLLTRKKGFRNVFTLIHISIVVLYLFERLLLVKGTIYAVTAGEVKPSIISDFNKILELAIRDTKFIYSSIFLLLITVVYVTFIRMKKHFRFNMTSAETRL
jgi:Tfp pilus assembly protein PilZ